MNRCDFAKLGKLCKNVMMISGFKKKNYANRRCNNKSEIW